MANLAISAGGAAIGYFVTGFNPVGAQVGWMLGSYASAKNQTPGQSTIADLRVQTASYGTNIPVIVGMQRVSGNIIWASDKRPYDIEQGGKGGSTVVGTGYKVSLAIALCKGPILGVRKAWVNGKLIVDASVNPDPMPGVVYLGDNTQAPDPTMQSYLGATNVPGYRGLAYIVLTDYDLGGSGAIPQFSFEVVKNGGM